MFSRDLYCRHVKTRTCLRKGKSIAVCFFNRPHLNPSTSKSLPLRVCSISLWQTLWEKEKLLVTSNFSFSHGVFYPFIEVSAIIIKFEIVVCKLFKLVRVLNLSFGKGLNSATYGLTHYQTTNFRLFQTERVCRRQFQI